MSFGSSSSLATSNSLEALVVAVDVVEERSASSPGVVQLVLNDGKTATLQGFPLALLSIGSKELLASWKLLLVALEDILADTELL